MLGTGLIYLGLCICLAGIITFLRCKSVAGKLLVGSIIDSCGFLTVMVGAMLRFGWNGNTVKVLLILAAVFIISPISAHEVARLSLEQGVGDVAGAPKEEWDA